jgi:alpha-galactosidase/6-phospho-beta-glucosidase family protein
VSTTQANVTTTFPPKPSQWQVIPIIDSLANDRPSVQQVSIKNKGVIPGLPDDGFVEVPALVDATGFHPLETYQLPDVLLQGILQPRQLLCDRIVSATRTGDIRFLLQTFLSDHKTASYEQAVTALSTLVAANPDMADHYQKTISFLQERAYSESGEMELSVLNV